MATATRPFPGRWLPLLHLVLLAFLVAAAEAWTGEIHGRIICDICDDAAIGPKDHILKGEYRSFVAAAMQEKKGILELRDRMDKTLSSPDLTGEDSLRSLLKKQILESSLSGSDKVAKEFGGEEKNG